MRSFVMTLLLLLIVSSMLYGCKKGGNATAPPSGAAGSPGAMGPGATGGAPGTPGGTGGMPGGPMAMGGAPGAVGPMGPVRPLPGREQLEETTPSPGAMGGAPGMPGGMGGAPGMPGGMGGMGAGMGAAGMAGGAAAPAAPKAPRYEPALRKGYDWVTDVVAPDTVVLKGLGQVHLAGVQGPRAWTEGYEEARGFVRQLLMFREVCLKNVEQKEVELTLYRPVFVEGELSAIDVNATVANYLHRVVLWDDRSGPGFQVTRDVTGSGEKSDS